MPGVLVRHRGRRGKTLGVQIVVLEPYNGGRGLRPNSWGSMAPYVVRLCQTAKTKGIEYLTHGGLETRRIFNTICRRRRMDDKRIQRHIICKLSTNY